MSTAAVEARSLSSLTVLASNPPSYPRNPTHVRNEPLVLYIARVPGSRDVFLTPMKPRDKVVSAEDVQSSLYYLHVDQGDDVRLRAPTRDSLAGGSYDTPSDQPPPPPVHRKPLSSSMVPQSMPNAPKRKPLPGTLTPQNDFENRQNISATGYAQRSPQFLTPNYSQQPSSGPPPYPVDDDEGPPLPPRTLYDPPNGPTKDENEAPPLPRRSSEYPTAVGTSLTLIRRDPASSAQWNVAHINDPQFADVSSSTVNDSGQKKKPGAPLYIEISNPGYSKFIHTDSRPSTPSNAASAPTTTGQIVAGSATFRRRVWMEGSKYSGGFGHRKINSHDSTLGNDPARGSFESWQQRGSVSSTLIPPETQPPFLTRDDQTYSTIQISNKGSVFRGYVFLSPWNGRCEFTTGAGGGSLKCRHTVAGLQGSMPASMTVSELRFNLPNSSKAATPRGDEPKRSSFFYHPRHSRNNSSVSDFGRSSMDEVNHSLDRLDLSLGEERAGGGFGGKQAKLGKLIIEDEGLKMVDLLVAANLALWWRAYEKVS
ncbi:hypothetical protein BCR34DRAFT_623900 [Clohesyomyces aquaticus]|uniref:Oxidoreductase-like protein n=1 Tax=Clohesyomyces aquaticus TaxID=1231657 RepID=A0A1Y1ZSU1_9PLEO|nr:hypothetical protein BCR34DRAFT_623900 [Clohesyomyces aquaticus]